MTFIEMLFKLVAYFGDIDTARIDTLRSESTLDMQKLEQKGGTVGKAITIQKHWLAQLLMVFVGISLRRGITAWISSPVEDSEESEEDEESKNKAMAELLVAMSSKRKSSVPFEKL